MEYFTKVFRQYADFKGRARRKEYWMFILFNSLILFGIGLIAGIAGSSGEGDMTPFYILLFPLAIYFLVSLIPTLAVTVRRLHDTGKSGWFILLQFIPYLGGLVLLIFMCIDSEYGENKWGPNPKNFGNSTDIDEIGNRY